MDTHRHMIHSGAVKHEVLAIPMCIFKTTSLVVFSFEPSLTCYGEINLLFI